MDSTASQSNAYKIGGLSVEFPYKPYGSQLAFMSKVITTLERARTQGHCHALLESPTGTGKSLSLLCSTLAWQRNFNPNRSCPSRIPHPGPRTDSTISQPSASDSMADNALVSGGGFIPEPEPSRNLAPGNLEQSPSVTNDRASKKRLIPTIFYASRTHSQISQLIREYRKTAYRVPMAVLASRKHYCTNKHVSTKENVDEECKFLIKGPDVGCAEFKNVHRVKGHPSLKKGGCLEVHDIEDLVGIGRSVTGCSYFAARSMAEEAQLVFCPYSYVLNPIIRKAMEVDLKGAIVILDEAHNIEDMARDAGSLEVEEEVLDILQVELGKLSMVDSVSEIYQPLFDMIQGIISWIGQRKNSLEKREFEHYFSCWTGDKALKELEEAGISQQYFKILQECAKKAIKAASDGELEGVHLTGISAITLEGLFSSLSYFFSGNGLNALDYQLALQRFVKRDSGHASSGWTHSLSLWCLNPAVVFREIADLSLSVILTSGTLSPMGSFVSELGVQFEVCMEAPHVIDMNSQVWAAVVSNGPGNFHLNASYKTADGYGFQDALGASLEEICKIVPGGALVFFPSYKLLEKLCFRWRQTGQWSRLNAQKTLFVEPRAKLDDFDSVLKGYYDSVNGIKQTLYSKLKGGHQRGFKNLCDRESPQNPLNGGGAAFLAVCRGKVSEGIDFSDEKARVVVIIGIPFPNKTDIQVVLKKRYNDKFKTSRNLLSGNEWYCFQAFRALNQAAGRCIRHRVDYGAIILLDERFNEERNTAYISKWLRKSINFYDNFSTSLQGLRTFFQNAEERFKKKDMNMSSTGLEKSAPGRENISSLKRSRVRKGLPRKRNRKRNKLNQHENQILSSDTAATVKIGPDKFFTGRTKDKVSLSQTKDGASAQIREEKAMNGCKEYSDLDHSIQKNSRCSEPVSIASSNYSEDQSVVTENPIEENPIAGSMVTNDGILNLSTVQASNQFSEQRSFCSSHVKQTISGDTTATVKIGLDKFLTGRTKDKVSLSQTKAGASAQIRKEKAMNDCKEYSDLDHSIQNNSKCSEPVSIALSNYSEDQSVVTENPIEENHIAGSRVTNDGSLNLAIVQTSNQFSDQQSFCSSHVIDSFENLSEGACALTVTPKRNMIRDVWNPEPELSSVDLSVNSRCQKMRTPISLWQGCHIRMDLFDSPDKESLCHVDSIRCADADCPEPEDLKLNLLRTCLDKKYVDSPSSSGLVENLRRHSEAVTGNATKICCSVCRNALGLPEKQFLVKCSLASSSKVYLASFLRNESLRNSQESLSRKNPESTPVMVADVSTVDHRLFCNRAIETAASQKDVWCEEDGCVFRTVFCPFCTNSETCLGLQIMATDAPNVHLLNKIFFYVDRLEIKNPETSDEKVPKRPSIMEPPDASGSALIEKYSYVPVSKSYRGLGTTKSKLRLPKRGVIAISDNSDEAHA